MEILVERLVFNYKYTEGKMYIDGEYFCDTLEDKDRGLDQTMSEEDIYAIKVYGETAIPTGLYKVILSYSNKFKKILPEILNVKCFSGARIHSLNFASQSLGCVGIGRKTDDGVISGGRKLQTILIQKMQTAIDNGENIKLLIICK